VPLMLIAFGEPGTGPKGIREWIYLALFRSAFPLVISWDGACPWLVAA
jgi:hypothetical protein